MPLFSDTSLHRADELVAQGPDPAWKPCGEVHEPRVQKTHHGPLGIKEISPGPDVGERRYSGCGNREAWVATEGGQ